MGADPRSAREIVGATAAIVRIERFDSHAVVTARGQSRLGKKRTVFAELALDPDIGWFVANAWDRPGGRFTWATFEGSSGTGFAWDGLPAGKHISVGGQLLRSSRTADMELVHSPINEDEVFLQ
ncbi:hypothetical protein [Marmoricola sp. RAF53]|uniref:hypothetical protein n=1 Tax=Marmoricola sp. RAF53 TaxID=3233059 RepID=UPI003F985BF3